MTESMNQPLRTILCKACGLFVQLAPSVDPNQPMVRIMVNADGSPHSRTCKPQKFPRIKTQAAGAVLPIMKDHEQPAPKTKRGERPGG